MSLCSVVHREMPSRIYYGLIHPPRGRVVTDPCSYSFCQNMLRADLLVLHALFRSQFHILFVARPAFPPIKNSTADVMHIRRISQINVRLTRFGYKQKRIM